jgi:hypothetical protein
MTAVSSLVEQWLADRGGPRRFEAGVRSSFDATQYELQGFGVEVRRKGNRFAVKRVDGRWQADRPMIARFPPREVALIVCAALVAESPVAAFLIFFLFLAGR